MDNFVLSFRLCFDNETYRMLHSSNRCCITACGFLLGLRRRSRTWHKIINTLGQRGNVLKRGTWAESEGTPNCKVRLRHLVNCSCVCAHIRILMMASPQYTFRNCELFGKADCCTLSTMPDECDDARLFWPCHKSGRGAHFRHHVDIYMYLPRQVCAVNWLMLEWVVEVSITSQPTRRGSYQIPRCCQCCYNRRPYSGELLTDQEIWHQAESRKETEGVGKKKRRSLLATTWLELCMAASASWLSTVLFPWCSSRQ